MGEFTIEKMVAKVLTVYEEMLRTRQSSN
jgi:hypothetical protein